MSQALVTDTFRQVRTDLLSKVAEFQTLLTPYGMRGERFAQIVLDCLGRTPALLQCEPKSIIRAAYYAAEIGLELGGPLGDAYLVPFWNEKKKRKEAQCIPGYRGLIHVAMAADPRIVKFGAEVVYERDVFLLKYGAHPELEHSPVWKDAGAAIGVYAIAFLNVGLPELVPQFAHMPIADVDAIRDKALGKMKEKWMRDQSPWVTSEPEMQKKTGIRRLVKMMNLRGTRAALALDLDAREYAEAPSARTARSEDLKAKLGGVPSEVVEGEIDE